MIKWGVYIVKKHTILELPAVIFLHSQLLVSILIFKVLVVPICNLCATFNSFIHFHFIFNKWEALLIHSCWGIIPVPYLIKMKSWNIIRENQVFKYTLGNDSTLYSRSGFLKYGNLEALTLLVVLWIFKIQYIDLQREMWN